MHHRIYIHCKAAPVEGWCDSDRRRNIFRGNAEGRSTGGIELLPNIGSSAMTFDFLSIPRSGLVLTRLNQRGHEISLEYFLETPLAQVMRVRVHTNIITSLPTPGLNE